LSSFLQAEETASMEAATTFINDFYHHHYPMNSDDHHHQEEYHMHHHHTSGLFAEASTSASFYEPDGLLLQAEDMPFAVEGLSSGVSTHGGGQQSSMSTNEASLMVAYMGMVPQRKLALFESSATANATANASGYNHNHHSDEAAASLVTGVDVNVDVDALTDQLADFRSFGATLASPSHSHAVAAVAVAPLTASVGSGG
jgi:hypothetical protein